MKRAILPPILLLVLTMAILPVTLQNEPQKQQDLLSLLAVGQSYVQSKDFDKAIETFRRAVELYPSSAQAHDNLGAAYGAVGRNADAVESLKMAIQLDPSMPSSYVNLGNAYTRLHRSTEAVKAFKHAQAINPEFVQAYLGLGADYVAMGQMEESVGPLKEAVRLAPENADAQATLGFSCMVTGRTDEAIEALTVAAQRNPDHPVANLLLGNIYYRKGQYQECVDALEKHGQHGTIDEDFYLDRGFSYLYLHRGEEAARDARACLKMVGWRNRSSQYMVLLGHFGYRLAEQGEQASKILEEATRFADTSAWPFPLIRYLRREFKAGDTIAQASNNDERTEAHGYIGMDLLLSGSRQEALEHFQWVKEYGNRLFVEYKLAKAEISQAENH